LGKLGTLIWKSEKALSEASDGLKEAGDTLAAAEYCRDRIIPAMDELRKYADEAETLVGREYWPFPTYGDILFGVR
ncbi:MAG: glutamine synthetase type III, partial [Clostridia bacterium]|nr:glutamine synthetase type III [Clostridia bacterium]